MAQADRRPLGPHVSQQQRHILVEFMEQHPCLVKGSSALTPDVTKATKAQLWRELAAALNAEGPATKTVEQWRNYWKKEVYNSRHDAAVVAAEHRGTGGGRLSGLRGRILSLVGRSSALGVCDDIYDEERSTPLPSSPQSLAGDSSSPQLQLRASCVLGTIPQPAEEGTPCRRQHRPQRILVGDEPGTSGLSRAGQHEKRTPSRRPGAEDYLPGIAAGYEKSLELGAAIKSELQQLKDAMASVAASTTQLAEAAAVQSAALHRLAAAAEAQADCHARQAISLERKVAIAEQQLNTETASQARLVAAAERQVLVGQLILQHLQRLAPASSGVAALPGGQIQ